MNWSTGNGDRRRAWWVAAAGACGIAILAATWQRGETPPAPEVLEPNVTPIEAGQGTEGELSAALRAPSEGTSERAPVEAAPEHKSPDAKLSASPAAPLTSTTPRMLLFCDGVPAANLSFKLPGEYGARAAPTTSDAEGFVAGWPTDTDAPWLRLSGSVLGSGSGDGAHASIERDVARLGLRRLLVEPRLPPGMESRRVTLSASMQATDGKGWHRQTTSVAADQGPGAFFAPCDRSFTIEASIERRSPLDPDLYGSAVISASARSDTVTPITLLPTYRGTLRVVDPSGSLGEVPYSLTCTAPNGRYRSPSHLVGKEYGVPPGEYTVRLDVETLARRDSDQVLTSTVYKCEVASGQDTSVTLELTAAARLRVSAVPGNYLEKGRGRFHALGHGDTFTVKLLRDGNAITPSRWFDTESESPQRCQVGLGAFTSSALQPGRFQVVFNCRGQLIGEPVEVSAGPGEVVDLVMPAQ